MPNSMFRSHPARVGRCGILWCTSAGSTSGRFTPWSRATRISDQNPAQGRPALAAWYRQHASRLVEVLTATPADAPAWTLDDRDPTAHFWRRRQVHETLMHTWDAHEALGRRRPMDPYLAWDGVLEVRDVIYPRQLRLGRVEPLSDAIRLVATDVPGDITMGEGEAAIVGGTAEVLLRLLWHRADPETETEMIDPRAGALMSHALTP